MTEINTQVTIGSLHMKNPVMPASGAYDYFEDNANVFPVSELGAIMLKSIHRRERMGNPAPRIHETAAGMLNAVGIPSVGIEAFIKNKSLEHYRELGAPIIVSISGNSAQDYVECLEFLNDQPDVAAVELNLSCPNVGTGLQLSSDVKTLTEVVSAARKATKHTIFAKLSPNVTDIRLTAKASEDAGADAVTIANTYMGIAISAKTKRPILGNKQGGLSGPAIKPLTLYKVYQAYSVVKIPIIGVGGIMCAEDAIEYILAGASAVQVGAGNFIEPMLMHNVIKGIEDYMRENDFPTIESFKGLAQG